MSFVLTLELESFGVLHSHCGAWEAIGVCSHTLEVGQVLEFYTLARQVLKFCTYTLELGQVFKRFRFNVRDLVVGQIQLLQIPDSYPHHFTCMRNYIIKDSSP